VGQLTDSTSVMVTRAGAMGRRPILRTFLIGFIEISPRIFFFNKYVPKNRRRNNSTKIVNKNKKVFISNNI